MQSHHLYARCASSTTMAARLSWYRVDANIACHFGLRSQDSGLPKIRLKFPSMISRSLCTPSCAAHRPSFAASLRATEGDTITIITLSDFGLLSFSLTIGKSWSLKLFPKPVGSRATTSPPATSQNLNQTLFLFRLQFANAGNILPNRTNSILCLHVRCRFRFP